eukprot:4805581-Prymnesium_polylepis.1
MISQWHVGAGRASSVGGAFGACSTDVGSISHCKISINSPCSRAPPGFETVPEPRPGSRSVSKRPPHGAAALVRNPGQRRGEWITCSSRCSWRSCTYTRSTSRTSHCCRRSSQPRCPTPSRSPPHPPADPIAQTRIAEQAQLIVLFRAMREVNSELKAALTPPQHSTLFTSWAYLKGLVLRHPTTWAPHCADAPLLRQLRLTDDAWRLLAALRTLPKDSLLHKLKSVVNIERPSRKGPGLPDEMYHSLLVMLAKEADTRGGQHSILSLASGLSSGSQRGCDAIRRRSVCACRSE